MNFRHGLSTTTEYISWWHMIQRCYNPEAQRYERYGGRGITVCESWRSNFLAFLHDMGHRPSPEHQLDRIDNDGHYTPSNCRWATRTEQAMNRGGGRATKNLTWNGETLHIRQWADRVGIPWRTLYNRLDKGWSVQRTLSEPFHEQKITHR